MDQGLIRAVSPLGVTMKLHQQDAEAVHRVAGCQCQWVIANRRKHRAGVLVDGTHATETQPVGPLAAIFQVFHPRFVMAPPRTQWQLGGVPGGLLIQLLPCAKGSTSTGCCMGENGRW